MKIRIRKGYSISVAPDFQREQEGPLAPALPPSGARERREIPLYYPESRFSSCGTLRNPGYNWDGRSPGGVGVFHHREVIASRIWYWLALLPREPVPSRRTDALKWQTNKKIPR